MVGSQVHSQLVPWKYVRDAEALAQKMEDHIEVRNGNPYNWSKNDFEFGHCLGKGKFGEVYIAREKTTKYIVAVKVIRKSRMKHNEMRKQVMREIEIQFHLRHPNILPLYTYFNDTENIFLVLEYAANRELYTVMKQKPLRRFEEREAAKYMFQVCSAVVYCHQNHIIHRDIKPENILLDIWGNVKLSDFGWSIQKRRKKPMMTVCGTLEYLAPEVILRRGYGFEFDNWGIGILCYELIVGSTPFKAQSEDKLFTHILNVDITFPVHVSKGAQNFILNLVQFEPENRLHLPFALKHYWIVNNMP